MGKIQIAVFLFSLVAASQAFAKNMLVCSMTAGQWNVAGGLGEAVIVDSNGEATIINQTYEVILTGNKKLDITIHKLPDNLPTPVIFEAQIKPGVQNGFAAHFRIKDPLDVTQELDLKFECLIDTTL